MRQNFEYYPLTHPQRGIWYTEKLYPGTSIGIIAGTLRIKEHVNFSVLERAINLFIEKNDSMRIRITEINGQPYQYFSDFKYRNIDFIDFSDKDINEMYRWDTLQTKTPFKLFESDLFYFALIKVNDNDAGFYIKCHHLISDAWTMSLLGSQIMVYYSALKTGSTISDDSNPSYVNFIQSEQNYLTTERMEKDRDYWSDIFKTYPGKTLLKEGVSNNTSFRARRKTMLTPKKLTSKINSFCSENKVSVFSLFMAALAMYINRVTSKEDIVLGTTTLNRSNALEKSTVGMYDNITPMRIYINDEMNFNNLIEYISSEGFKLLRHQKYPYDMIMKMIREKHKIDDKIFDIVLIYQNSKFLKDNLEEQYSTRWHFNGYQVDSLHISINDRENEGQLIIDYDYQTELFQAKEVEFIHQNIISILWHALDNPSKKISHLEMLSEKEKHKILFDFNKTKIIVPQGLKKLYDDLVIEIPEKAKSYILDKNLNLLPIGISGDLYLSGDCLREEAISNPYLPGEFIYPAGVRARWFPDGDIMFTGVNNTKAEAVDNYKSIKIDIMSTFTAEPIEEYVRLWCSKFGYSADVKFAEYNQIFQELLNPDSMMAENTDGINVALVRFEDFIRFEKGADKKKIAVLESTYHDFMSSLYRFGNGIPLVIAIFPVSKNSGLSCVLQKKIDQINRDIISSLSKHRNIFIMDFYGLGALYNIQETFDSLKDKEAHMPFTDEYYAAAGTEIAREIIAIKKQTFKIIVLDCDNTLWKGICGEAGALGVQVTKPFKKLQQFMLKKYHEGFLLAICSKNNKEDVFEVFGKNPEMVLKQEYIINWKVSWDEKSNAIKEISQELGIGLDSFIFIDDDSLECLKMLEKCPEVLTLQLPSEDDQICSFLNHIWAFDKVRVTTEDSSRNLMYQQENKRKALRDKEISLESFLKSLGLKVSMRLASEADIARAAQLTQRTNQFNLNTIRRTEEEISLLLEDETITCFILEASDKFGDYGIIGLIILKKANETLYIDTLLMSCRIFGRNVEDVMMAGICRYADEIGIQKIEGTFVPTPKNNVIYSFIKRANWRLIDKTEMAERYSIIPADQTLSIKHIDFYYKDTYKKAAEEQVIQDNDTITDVKSFKTDVSIAVAKREFYFNTAVMDKNDYHKAFIEPLHYSSGKKLVQIYGNNDIDLFKTAACDNEIQRKLIKMWESVLKVNGIRPDSDFFELGGDSLYAVILLSKIKNEFGAELTLRDIFQFSTIRKLEQKIKESDISEYGHITPVEKRQYYELSSAQKRMYILNKIEEDQIAYNECHKIVIEGKLDKAKLETAFREFIQRHEIMRTGFEIVDGRPMQKVYDSIDFSISYQNAEDINLNGLIDEFIKPFDLSKPPLIRVSLIETGTEQFILLIDIHHIIIDGSSFGILIREIQAFYEGRELDYPKLQYKDFASWQNELIKLPQMSKQRQFWIDQFKGDIPALNLPANAVRMPVQSFSGKKRFFTVGADNVKELRAVCAASGSTLFMLLFAAFNILLHRYSGQEDIVVGIPVSGRRHNDTRDIVGIFVNSLPIRTFINGKSSFSEYLSNVKNAIIMGLENQDYQYDMLVDELNITADLSRNPLFDVLFSFQNSDMVEPDIPGLSMQLCSLDNHKSKFDISMMVSERNEDLIFCIEYCTDLFNDEYMARFQDHYMNILGEVTADLNKTISDIEIMDETEKRSILDNLNDTGADYSRDMTIHRLFEEQVRKTPNRVAVVFEDKKLTYYELNAKANQLARVLRKKGVKPDTIVAIMVERSLEMIIGILAILKAGGAYLPIDPEYPTERVQYMLEDSKTRILITQKNLTDKGCIVEDVLFIDDENLFSGDFSNLLDLTGPDNLIYLIFTSGSTGKPKGVMLEHRNISNFIKGITDRINMNSDDVMLCITTISFDIFVLETWLPITRGMTTVIANKSEQLDIGLLTDAVVRNDITILQMTPSQMRLVCEDARADKLFRNLKIIMLGGEPLPQSLFESVKRKTTARIYNMYGPTETAVWSSVEDLTDESEISIGKPINNTQFYILNDSLRLQPVGIPGELFIAGDGLARGYFNKPELTNERFIENPVDGKGKAYKTGDLAVLDYSGNVRVLGRLDHQIKLGGHRIELEEIEKVILLYDGITECAVTLKQQGDTSQFLCAFLVSDQQIPEDALLNLLKGKLPGYMIPKQFIRLDKLPLTGNNKVDRQKLNEIETETYSGTDATRPEGEIQQRLEEIFRKILDVESIGANQNLLNLGADSLQIIRITIEIFNAFGVELRYAEIIRSNTIQSLSTLISKKLLNDYKDDIDIGSIYALLNEKREINLFAFPPVTGFGLAFNEMAKNMKDISLYAFNYIEDEDKIDQYYYAIKEIQKDGPYILLGFSAGADIVYELSGKFSEKAVIILMDGFWGEVDVKDIEERVKFFIDYSISYVNLDKDNKFLHQILERRIRSYIKYILNKDKFRSVIDNDIHFLYSDELTDQDINKLNALTNGSIFRYKAFGKHFDLLQKGYVERNTKILTDIIKASTF